MEFGGDDITQRAPDADPRRYRLAGLFAESDRGPEFRRLILSRDGSRYVEFRTDDVEEHADVPPDQPPFLGEQATSVVLRAGAQAFFTQVEVAATPEDWDLDARLRTLPAGPPQFPGLDSDTELCVTRRLRSGTCRFCAVDP